MGWACDLYKMMKDPKTSLFSFKKVDRDSLDIFKQIGKIKEKPERPPANKGKQLCRSNTPPATPNSKKGAQ